MQHCPSTCYGISYHLSHEHLPVSIPSRFSQLSPITPDNRTGAETNMMRASLAWHIGAKVTKSSQTTLQADGRTPLAVAGETHLPLICHGIPLSLETLIVEDLDVDILARTPPKQLATTSQSGTLNLRSSSLGVTWCPTCMVVPPPPSHPEH